MEGFFARSEVESEGFFESFDEEGAKAVRLNSLKVDKSVREEVLEQLAPAVDPVPWCDGGFYTDEQTGNSPYYHAGVYYPQEPSAMLPASVLAAKPGDIVIDLCAAPGGKAVRIGEDLKGEGVLIANEISEKRSHALLRNIERSGIANALVVNEDPVNMREIFAESADKIIVDAPCSGEGMFRRDPGAVKAWEQYGPASCVTLQASILESADMMLKPGGELVYSTCTFCEDEDEKQILEFMKLHKEYEVIPHPEIQGVSHMGPDGILPGSMRIWPQLARGDGHFCVHLKKGLAESFDAPSQGLSGKLAPDLKEDKKLDLSRKACLDFMKEILNDEAYENFKKQIKGLRVNGTHAFIPSLNPAGVKRIHTIKNGLYLGEFKQKGKDLMLVPSHSLALTLNRNDLKDSAVLDLNYDDPLVSRYLKGETLVTSPGFKGYTVITVDGFPVGFGKRSNDGFIKNLYPKAWRLL